MKTESRKQSFFQRSRNIILIFISLAFLMISNALFEFHQSKQELYQLMREQALSLLRSLVVASHNSLLTNEYLEKLSDARLFNNANLVKKLYENGQINNQTLAKISKENDIFRIHVFNSDGKREFSSHLPGHPGIADAIPNRSILAPIFTGETDTLVIGLRPARYPGGYRYAIALAGKNREAIVLSVDASHILEFKRNIGFGALLRNVAAENPNIVYVALQDTQNILAASGNVKVLEAVSSSDYLSKSWHDSLFQTRTISFDSLDVYEATQLFTFRGTTVGLLRVGLSMKPIEEINTRIYRRLITLTLVLIIIGSFLLIFIFTRQRLMFLKKQYSIVETYSGNIVDNVSDAIIVSDPAGGMRIFNTAAEDLFEIKRQNISGQSVSELFSESDLAKINSFTDPFLEIRCLIKKRTKHLFVSKSTFKDSDNEDNLILVIRDLTKQRLMEEQLQRKQRLSAMGELASGVAHEIRNPLNTIGTIIQQLKKDFRPNQNVAEYDELSALVISEVQRINGTIQDFLRFARPEPIQAMSFEVDTLFKQIEKQFRFILDENQITFNLNLIWKGAVNWDKHQILQVLINIIQNSIEAIGKKGTINTRLEAIDVHTLEIRISDDGPGMSPEIRSNIFNLYFTTKAKGTGIGLSIVQRIIFEHGGVISVDSQINHGTTFIIQLPVNYQP